MIDSTRQEVDCFKRGFHRGPAMMLLPFQANLRKIKSKGTLSTIQKNGSQIVTILTSNITRFLLVRHTKYIHTGFHDISTPPLSSASPSSSISYSAIEAYRHIVNCGNSHQIPISEWCTVYTPKTKKKKKKLFSSNISALTYDSVFGNIPEMLLISYGKCRLDIS